MNAAADYKARSAAFRQIIDILTPLNPGDRDAVVESLWLLRDVIHKFGSRRSRRRKGKR